MKQNPALHTRKCRHTALGIGSDLKRVIPGAGLVLLACVLACGEEAAPETSSKPPDEAARFFGLDRLWTMHLILEAAHWTAMEPVRPEGSMGPRGPGRMERDYPEVPGELEWEGHRWTGVSVRYKGNSSFNFAGDSLKRSLKLDFNDLVKGQRFLGLTKLNLNNNTMDATQMQEAIAYDLFRRAGIPAPRTAFVRVYLTVPARFDRRYLGLYTAIEQVDERLLEKQLGTSKGLLLKPETAPGIPYFGNVWSAYKTAYDPKSKASADEKTRLMAFARFVREADAATFIREIGSFLEVDAFLRFLAANVVLANYDSYLAVGHNYYLHLDPRSNRFRFIPWDLNHAFGKFPMVGTPTDQMQGRFMPPNVSANPLIEKVMAEPENAAAYRRHVQQILEHFFQPARLHAQVDAIVTLIRDAIPGDALYTPEEFARAVGGVEARDGEAEAPRGAQRPGGRGPAGWDRGPSLKNWIAGRAESLQAQLEGQIPGTALTFSPGRPGGPGGRNGPAGMGLAGAVGPRLFQAADTNQDRLVNRTELASFIRQGFTKIDSDANGKVDEAELSEWLQASLPPPPQNRRPADQPGAAKPLDSPPNRANAPGQMLAPRLLKEWDVARNGVVTLEEAQQAGGSAFDRRDNNRDGGLDLEEWMRWIEFLVGPPPRAGQDALLLRP
jgi:hypothetical protein